MKLKYQLNKDQLYKISLEEEKFPYLIKGLKDELHKKSSAIDMTIEYAHTLFDLLYPNIPFNLTGFYKIFK